MAVKVDVKGVAIRAGKSRNGILYTSKELAKFAPTLTGRPILRDHKNETMNAIGLVEGSRWNKSDETVRYAGWVKDDGTNERIKDKRIKEVSIGALAGKMVKEKEDSDHYIAKDLVGLELSTVAVPGVVGTSISQTLEQLNHAKTPEERLRVKPVLENMNLFENIQGENTIVVNKDNTLSNEKNITNEDTEENKNNITKEKVIVKMVEEKPNTENVESSASEKMAKVITKTEEKLDKALEGAKEMTKTIEAKDTALAESEAKLVEMQEKLKEFEAKEHAAAKARLDALAEKYKKLAEEKDVDAEDTENIDEATLNLLVKTLESIKLEKKQEVRGKVSVGKENSTNELFAIEKASMGGMVNIVMNPYSYGKFKRD